MPLRHAELLQLQRWNTPTIYNGWEQITSRNIAREGFNLEETHDFMPQMGPMVGYAVTVVIEPSERSHKAVTESGAKYREYVAKLPGPKIVVVQDLDKPAVIGSFWGEVNSNIHRSLGCVGTITDGAIRDLDEMTGAGFKAIARRLCVGHAHVCPVRWGCEVDVFGTTVRPGQLIHADKHGFMAIDEDEVPQLLEAAVWMDKNECETVIEAARCTDSPTLSNRVEQIDAAATQFRQATKEHFAKKTN